MAADVELTGAVRAALRGAAQPDLARPTQAYMKSATPFLGVRVPVMRTLTRAEAKLRPFTTSADLIDTVLRLWREAGYREERYAAITLPGTPTARRLRDPAVLQTLEELIVTGAWWDYVDELAHRTGDLLAGWPAEVRPALLTWPRSDHRCTREQITSSTEASGSGTASAPLASRVASTSASALRRRSRPWHRPAGFQCV